MPANSRSIEHIAIADNCDGLILSDEFDQRDIVTDLSLGMRERIAHLLERHRVALYWLYLRSRNSPGIADEVDSTAPAETAPARALHTFFSGMGTPYRVYDSENPQALARAIADVNRLQNLPIRYHDLVPRRDLSALCYAAALALLVVLIAAKLLEVRRWQ